MEAFGEAVAIADEDALKEMLGAKFRELIPPVGTDDRYRFLEAWARSHVIEGNDGKMARVAAGGDGWTLPIPLVKAAAGWQFDTAAGAEEMRVRRIGRNELAAQQTLLAIYDACLSRPWQPRGRRMPGRTAITAITISYSPGRALTLAAARSTMS